MSLCGRLSKGLSDHFFTLLPECRGIAGIKRIAAHAFGDRVENNIIPYYLANMAVLTILSADLVSTGYYPSPDGGCCSLLHCLPFQGPLTFV